MKPSAFDPCLLFNNNQSAIIGLQAVDSSIFATPSFMGTEHYKLKEAKFLSEPIEQLKSNHPLKFNGFMMTLKSNNINISQGEQLKKIDLFKKRLH